MKIALLIGKFVPLPAIHSPLPLPTTIHAFGRIQSTGDMHQDGLAVEKLDCFSADGQSGATVKIFDENGHIQLEYSQYGLANVLVYRPGAGLVFPEPSLFVVAMEDKYSAWECIETVKIADYFQVGDVVLITIPSKSDDISPSQLVEASKSFHETGKMAINTLYSVGIIVAQNSEIIDSSNKSGKKVYHSRDFSDDSQPDGKKPKVLDK